MVVHLTSDAAVSAYPRWGAYGVSKVALEHLGRIWAAELEGTGVRFFNVDPGDMDTKMHSDAIPDADPATPLRGRTRWPPASSTLLAARGESYPRGSRLEASAMEAA